MHPAANNLMKLQPKVIKLQAESLSAFYSHLFEIPFYGFNINIMFKCGFILLIIFQTKAYLIRVWLTIFTAITATNIIDNIAILWLITLYPLSLKRGDPVSNVNQIVLGERLGKHISR